MIKSLPPFDPNETKDYAINWTDEMEAYSDTIETTTFDVITVDSGLSVAAFSVAADQKRAVVWLTADNLTQLNAKVGSSVLIDHTITTTGGRVLNETISLKIRAK